MTEPKLFRRIRDELKRTIRLLLDQLRRDHPEDRPLWRLAFSAVPSNRLQTGTPGKGSGEREGEFASDAKTEAISRGARQHPGSYHLKVD